MLGAFLLADSFPTCNLLEKGQPFVVLIFRLELASMRLGKVRS